MKTAKRSRTPTLDLEREKEWAEVILASQDMRHVLELLWGLPPGDATDPAVILASIGIVTAYCRPFTTNKRKKKVGRIVGKQWTSAFSSDESALHRKALMLRGSDLAHTEPYAGRVSIHLEKITAGEDIRYSVRTSFRGFTRPEFHMLAQMVSKVREQIEIESKKLGKAVVRDRVSAGYTREFVLGERGTSSDGT